MTTEQTPENKTPEILLYIEEKCEELGIDYAYGLSMLKGKYSDSTPTKSSITKFLKKLVKDHEAEQNPTANEKPQQSQDEPQDPNKRQPYFRETHADALYLGKDPRTGEPKFADLHR